jgi:ribulose-5-phosphate 4-epimerase/fuculose-1-phosphate aldolase
MTVTRLSPRHNLQTERTDLAAAFRWVARLNMHEGVANHFSLAVNEDGTEFLMNPNQLHFSLVRASDLLHLDAKDPQTMNRPGAPDPTAWHLHSTIHRNLPHARCAMHVHSVHATVLACLEDPLLPPLDQNACMFWGRQAVDTEYGGLAFEEEAERVCARLADPKVQVLVMGNHGIMVIGRSVADTLNKLYYFEKAAETYIKALWTGRPLRFIAPKVAERVAREVEAYPEMAEKLLASVHALLTRDGEDYRD